MRDTINIPAFGGINKLHTRNLGQPSKGRNFWTRGGSLVSRDGLSLLAGTPPFTSSIKSIHTGVRAGVPSRLLVEESSRLWVRPQAGAAWTQLRSNITGSGFNSAIWKGFLLLFSGTQMLSYDIQNNTVSDITNSGGNPVPAMQNVAVDKDIIFGWAPNFPDGHLVRFNGYTRDAQGFILGRSQNEWPPDFALNVSGTSGTPILDVIPYRGYRYCLTQVGSHLIYGDNENDFRILQGDNIGVFRAGCSVLTGNIIIWLNFDIKGLPKVYAFSGTQPSVISLPIEELLMNEDYSHVFAKAYANQFWLIFPGFTNTNCYVYDIDEQQWYIYTLPTVLRSSTMFTEYLSSQFIHFGSKSGDITQFFNRSMRAVGFTGGEYNSGTYNVNNYNNLGPWEVASTDLGFPITTELVLGSFSTGDRRARLKRVWLEVEPRNNFTVQIYATADQQPERGPFIISAVAGNTVKLGTRIHGVRGRSISVRLVTRSRVDELQQVTLNLTRGGD